MRLRNKVELVTGSSNVIGKGIAFGYAKEGADLIINYNTRRDKAYELKKNIESIEKKPYYKS